VEFVSNNIRYIVLRGHWWNIIVLNAHEPSEEKSDDAEESFMRNQSKFSIMFLSNI